MESKTTENNQTGKTPEKNPLITAAVALFIIAAVTYAVIGFLNSGFFDKTEASADFTTTGVSVSYNTSSMSVFYSYPAKDGFFYATRDGIKYITSEGNELMSRTYTISNPEMSGRGSFVAVLEKNGTSAAVYNAAGELYSVITEYPILNYSIGATGYLSLILKKGENYYMTVYNEFGTVIAKGDLAYKNTIPVATDISNDGRIHAICFLDISGEDINYFINFYYLDSKESIDYLHQDGMFSSSGDNFGQMPGLIRFMDGNKLIAVSDKEIACYEPENKNSDKKTVALHNKVEKITVSEPSCFAVALGEGFINQPAEKEGLVLFFDLNLNQTGKFESDGKVTALTAAFKSILIGTDRSFYAVSTTGTQIWHYDATHDIRQILFLGGTSKILLAGTVEANVLRIPK